MTKQSKWEVIDPKDGGVVFTADTIESEFLVQHGHRTPRQMAQKLARENSDPMHEPLQARRVAD